MTWHYQPRQPELRTCGFVHCKRGVFVAHRRDARYCSARCRSDAADHRHGRVLIGTGMRGARAVRFYRERRYIQLIKEAV